MFMIKNMSIFLVIACAALLNICQKSSDTKLPFPGGLKVKSYTENITSANQEKSVTIYNLGYDGSDRIISTLNITRI